MFWLLLGACSFASPPETGFVAFDTGSFCFDTGEDLRYADVDGDGYGDPDAALTRCDAPESFVKRAGDCNDARADMNPAAPDACGDGVDMDCDGSDPTCR